VPLRHRYASHYYRRKNFSFNSMIVTRRALMFLAAFDIFRGGAVELPPAWVVHASLEGAWMVGRSSILEGAEPAPSVPNCSPQATTPRLGARWPYQPARSLKGVRL
jgi:hypothetical protein